MQELKPISIIKNDSGLYRNLNVALVSVLNPRKKHPINKDLNGGLGTGDTIGTSWSSKLIQFMRKKTNRLPIIAFAHLHAIFEEKEVGNLNFFEGTLPNKRSQDFNLILIYGSIVDYYYENEVCSGLKRNYPLAKVGFFGEFPTRKPDLFESGDFVIMGEAEAYFTDEYSSLDALDGRVVVEKRTRLDSLPLPNLDQFELNNYEYKPGLISKPFITIQGSKGCPYSCSYYCTYGAFQGAAIRQRSVSKIVDDIVELQRKYGIKSVQFRDPLFGVKKGLIEEFSAELKSRKVKLEWGMETRLDLLNEDNLSMMFDVGLRLINVGVETKDPFVAKQNKRKLVKEDYQERIVDYCRKKGIKVSAFYILGLESDTEETIKETIEYAISLNTFLARFSISTPYPGTAFFDDLNMAGRILTHEYEEYTQFNLVYEHQNLTPAQAKRLLEYAYRRYYIRPLFFIELLKWKIRELWL